MIEIEVKGVQEILKKIGSGIVNLSLQEGIKKATLLLERITKQATPVGTPQSTRRKGYHGGYLRSRITSDVYPDFGKVGTLVEYAKFVEFGTSKMQPRHLEGRQRIKGQGMFAYAIEKTKEEIGRIAKEIGMAIEARFNK